MLSQELKRALELMAILTETEIHLAPRRRATARPQSPCDVRPLPKIKLLSGVSRPLTLSLTPVRDSPALIGAARIGVDDDDSSVRVR